MSERAIQRLLSFFVEHHFERLPKNDSNLLEIFKILNSGDACRSSVYNNHDDEKDGILINSNLLIGELERLVEELGRCDFRDEKYLGKSWLWRVLCLNENCTISCNELERNEEIEKKDADLVKLGEWLLKNGKSNPNEVYTPINHEDLHILYVCARGGSLEKVKLLLRHGADVKSFSKLRFYYETPISIAFQTKHFDIVKVLCNEDYLVLFDMGWYELMDGFEYSPLELAQENRENKDFIRHAHFFAKEYVSGRCDDSSIVCVMKFLGEEILESFERECNKLREINFIGRLGQQSGVLCDLKVVCLD